MILSIALFYLIGNTSLHVPVLSHLSPWLALPFALLFATLCWLRLPFAIALLPLTLPYYLYQKQLSSSIAFSLVELTLFLIVAVAVVQMILFQHSWPYWLSWKALRERLGPFVVPMLLFLLIATLSILVAYSRKAALRTFREEIFDPLLYLVLALMCLRTRTDVQRLLGAFLGTGLIIALLGLAQYFLFKNTLVPEANGVRRVHTVYGSANSIGLLFDYILPIGIAWLLGRVSGRSRLVALLVCLPIVIVLYLTQSYGAWIAIGLTTLFIAALSAPNRRVLLIGSAVLTVVLGGALLLFHKQIITTVFTGHTNKHGVGTIEKRFYLWQSALHMIHDYPWLGVGLDNWLCHYSTNPACPALTFHYWIKNDPITGVPTGLTDEPTLSHPHNLFLHIWVSMGVFGMLTFAILLVFIACLFVRLILFLRRTPLKHHGLFSWMTLGVGGALLAAVIQGQVDSSFLEQDLAFCFWMLVSALFLLRFHLQVSWREVFLQQKADA